MELSSTSDLDILQLNPTRTPRRAALDRPKTIHCLNIYETDEESDLQSFENWKSTLETPISENYMLVRAEMTTSAGTYVKEFVHSDNQRTRF